MFTALILNLIFSLFSPRNIAAVTSIKIATPSAQATSSANGDTLLNNEDIQKIRDAVKQKVQEKLKSITATDSASQTTTKKAIIGTIIQIDKNNLTIDYQNNTRKISFTTDTVIINAKQIKVKTDSLKVGQDILAMGYVNNNILEAKRIVFMDLKTIDTQDQIVVGQIVDISKSSPIIVLIPSKNKNSQYQIKTDSKTEIVSKSNQKIDIKNLVSGQKVIAVVHPDAKIAKTYLATKIISIGNIPIASPTAAKKK